MTRKTERKKKIPISLAEEEQRMKALHHTQGYQRRIAKAFHKKVKIRHVQQGDLVLKENRAPLHDPRGKFKRAYVVKEVLPGKAIKLTPRIHLNLILALNDPLLVWLILVYCGSCSTWPGIS